MLWFYFLYLINIFLRDDFKNNTSGSDERQCINNETSISIIRLNHEKMNLLKYLENGNNSQHNKLNKIYNYNFFDNSNSNFVPNISKGLTWDNEFNI